MELEAAGDEPEGPPAEERSVADLLREAMPEEGAATDFFTSIIDASPRSYIEVDSRPRKCRPEDPKDYLRRLSTFRAPWWFNKPLGLSPIACARRGWCNVGPDVAECEVCSGELRLERSTLGFWLVNGQPMQALGSQKSPEEAAATSQALLPPSWATCIVALQQGHSPFCPWRSHEVALADLSRLSDRELAESVERRKRGLETALEHVPVVLEGGQEAPDALESLASGGWEPLGSSKAEGLEYLRCSLCLRTVTVQAFSHRPPDRGSEGPPKKVARTDPRPPVAGQWTPKLRGLGVSEKVVAEAAAAAAAQADLVGFDPHALHRYFCPLYCRPDEELSPEAARVLKARAAALMTASSKANADAELGPAAAAGRAVERAESLLRALDAILPPPS